jgi:hypothetical protein
MTKRLFAEVSISNQKKYEQGANLVFPLKWLANWFPLTKNFFLMKNWNKLDLIKFQGLPLPLDLKKN